MESSREDAKKEKEKDKDKDKDKESVKEKADSDIEAHMKLYEPVKSALEVIAGNIGEVERLKAKDQQTANEKGRKEIMEQLNKLMEQTNAHAAAVKKKLDDIKADNEAFQQKHAKEGASAKLQMRQNLYQTYARKFHQVMNDYNTASQEFKRSLKERIKRQLKIVEPDMTEDEVQKIVDSGQANDVIKKALISENLQNVVADIEERHQEILALERQVLEVFELFKDLATLVDLQQESLDVIETRIQNSRAYVESGEKELKQAEEYQRKSRKKQCIILACVVVVLVVILAPLLTTLTKTS